MFIFNEIKDNILCKRLLESEKTTVTDLYLFLEWNLSSFNSLLWTELIFYSVVPFFAKAIAWHYKRLIYLQKCFLYVKKRDFIFFWEYVRFLHYLKICQTLGIWFDYIYNSLIVNKCSLSERSRYFKKWNTYLFHSVGME